MRILITGADSFIGKNLKVELLNRKYNNVIEINNTNDVELLKQYIDESDFIFHLLTIYRSDNESAFERINTETTRKIVELIGNQPKSLILMSSAQAGNGTPYGQSKLHSEECVKEWIHTTGNKAYIFRVANEFGKWCPPNLNSVVATFCNNIANGRDIEIEQPDALLKLMYIDDIIDAFISIVRNGIESGYRDVSPVYDTTVGEVAKILYSFKAMRAVKDLPNMESGLIRKLYSTYLTYLPTDGLSVPLLTHMDERGSFTELLHFQGMGQVSINISKPGITKGNHWHHTKNEKFLVINGNGVIRLRRVGESEVIEYYVSGDKIEVVDIPSGYTHNISNIGESDLLTIMWANEIFDNKKPDTYYEEV